MRIFLCCLLALVLGACVSDEEVQTLHNRLNDQTRQIQTLESKLDQTSSQFTQFSDVRPTQANLWAEIEGLRSRTAAVEGRIDSLEHSVTGQSASKEELDKVSQQVAELDRKLNFAASQLALEFNPAPQAQGNATMAGTPAAGSAPVPGLGSPPIVTGAAPASQEVQNPAQALYDQAMSQFQERKYDMAQSIWAEFIKTFQDNPLIPNAYFWQGESYYQMEDYARAILSYQEVVTKFPDSLKYKTALLKQGISFYKLGKKQAGRLILQNVIQNFPDTPEAKRAQAFLRTNT